MANKTVYPYGTGGTLPASIGIINDLTTGGADKALSAEQGKVIGGKLETYDDVVDDLYGVEREISQQVNFANEPLENISIDADTFYYSSTSKAYKGYIINIPDGAETVEITAGPNGSFFALAKTGVAKGSTIAGSSFAANYLATGCTGYTPTSPSAYRMVIAPGTTVTISLSQNANILYVMKVYTATSSDVTPSGIEFSGTTRKDGRLDVIGKGSGGMFDGISFTRGALDENGNLVQDNNRLVSNPIPTSAGYYMETNSSMYSVEDVALYDSGGACVNRYFYPYIEGVIGRKLYLGNAVSLSGYFMRFVFLRRDGFESSPDDLVLSNFTMLNDKRLKRTIPENATKFQLFQERVKAQTNVVWKPFAKVPAPNAKLPYFYNGGIVHFGLPYSDVGEYSKYVGFDVSLRTFLTALLNPRSVMYTENASSEASSSKYGITYHNYENAAGTYYGSVCSGLTGYALGLPEIITSALYGAGKISGESVIAKGDQSNKYYIKDGNSWTVCTKEDILDLIQPMDLITSPGHVSFISDIYTDEYGNKKYIIWTEETRGAVPVAKSTPYTTGHFIERLDGYSAQTEGWSIIRYDRDSATPVQDDRDSVPMEWYEYPKHITIDPDICTYAGDYVVFTIGDAADTANNNRAFLNIHRDGDKYDTLQIFAEDADETTDSPVATVDISTNSGTFIYNSTNIFEDDASDKDDWIVVDLKQLTSALTHGKYKARVIKSGGTAASGFTHFQMVDVNFTVTGTSTSDMVCNYSSEEGTPFYIRRERLDGLGAHNGSISYQREIPEGETSCTNPRNWAINSTNRYVKVFVKADYGTAVKRIDVYGQFNS